MIRSSRILGQQTVRQTLEHRSAWTMEVEIMDLFAKRIAINMSLRWEKGPERGRGRNAGRAVPLPLRGRIVSVGEGGLAGLGEGDEVGVRLAPIHVVVLAVLTDANSNAKRTVARRHAAGPFFAGDLRRRVSLTTAARRDSGANPTFLREN